MAHKKLTDAKKVERARASLLRALTEIRDNSNRAEVLGFVTGQIAWTFALLDANKEDELGIVYVAAQIMDELEPKEKKPILPPLPGQLSLPEITELPQGKKK